MSDLQEYKCPCCNGAVKFDSSLQKMKCPYCDAEYEMSALLSYDEDLNSATEESMEWESVSDSDWGGEQAEGLRSYVCQSCGGEIIADETTGASECPYCGNPVVMKGQFSGELKPDIVIPFKFDKAAAEAALKQHYKGKKLLPKAFRDQNRIEEIKGVYVPFWLFDADADANIHYKATKVRTWDEGNYRCKETSYYSVVRAGKLSFENVSVNGSTKMAADLTESVEPFDASEAAAFQTAFLSGYLADKYDITAEQSEPRANERIKRGVEQEFRSTVTGYDTVSEQNTSIRLENGKVRYALYPMWILSTTWNGERYMFAMNGQTGKFVGNLPMDKGAFFRWLFGLAIGIGALVFLLCYLFRLI